MRQHLNEAHQAIYDWHFDRALKAVADIQQAHGIARERTLRDVMRVSAARAAARQISAARGNPPRGLALEHPE